VPSKDELLPAAYLSAIAVVELMIGVLPAIILFCHNAVLAVVKLVTEAFSNRSPLLKSKNKELKTFNSDDLLILAAALTFPFLTSLDVFPHDAYFLSDEIDLT